MDGKYTLKVKYMAFADLIKNPSVTSTPRVTPMIKKEKVVEKQETQPAPKVYGPKDLFITDFGRTLKKAELWFGEPSNGKTTRAKVLCESFKEQGAIEDYSIINCDEEMTVMSMFKTSKTDEDGNWKFLHNRVFKMLTDELERTYIIVFDEFNLLPMSVMKATQPIIDDTVGNFEFEDKTFKKNPNVYFIATMNHDDIGTSELPTAVIDRFYPKYFPGLTINQLEERTKIPTKIIVLLEKIRHMFDHLGNIPPFHKSVRQLNYLRGATSQELKIYIESQLEFAKINYKEVIELSPEFDNLMEEFEKIEWGE